MPAYPEYVWRGALVGGLEGDEGDAVVQGRVAEDARSKDGTLRNVARGEDAGEYVREALLHRLGVAVPHQLLGARLLHGWLWERGEGKLSMGKIAFR